MFEATGGTERDVIALGRAGVDFNPVEINRPWEETENYYKTVGGSPANIAIGLARLGMKTGFIGKVSDDVFGRYVRSHLSRNGVDTTGLATDATGAANSFAFTEIRGENECSAHFIRQNPADLLLTPGDINEGYVARARAIFISGTALAKSPSREAVFLAVDYARKHRRHVFMDLDYRRFNWTSAEETALYYTMAAERSSLVIGTREEFDCMESVSMPGNRDDARSAEQLLRCGVEMVVIKRGGDGSTAFLRDGRKIPCGVFPVTVKKTYGAGDSYASGLVYGLFSGMDIHSSMVRGSASAAINISGTDCSGIMPTRGELEKYVGVSALRE